MILLLPLLCGWLLDLWLGDPPRLPHPVVAMGRLIAFGEKRLNKGTQRKLKGGLWAVGCILTTFLTADFIVKLPFIILHAAPTHFSPFAAVVLHIGVSTILLFFCLAGKTLRREVRMVFEAVDRSIDDGRHQVSRIVGRDTASLSTQDVRTAALETLAENLSDGVVAPLFWFFLLGIPGMMAYKMVNTLDSMIGYRTERYRDFGFLAAKIDDVANYIPARITALLMIAVARIGRLHPSYLTTTPTRLLPFLFYFGPRHASPNSGWPEAALAGILDCRFGGTHNYFGETIYKPYIGTNPRPLQTDDMRLSIRLALLTEITLIILLLIIFAILIVF